MVDTDVGHRLITDKVGELRPKSGLRFTIGRIDGSIYTRATLVDVRVYDPEGLVFAAPRAELDWRPLAWLSNRLVINRLIVPSATLAKLPKTRPSGENKPILPGFDLHIGELRIDRLAVAPAVTGIARGGRVQARADIAAGRARVGIAAVIEGSDRFSMRLDAEPARDQFDLDVQAEGSADGVLARLSGIRHPLALSVTGDGRWAMWRGTATARARDTRVLDLALTNRSGHYTLSGTIAPHLITKGKLQRLTDPQVEINGDATYAHRRVEGAVSLRSSALAVDTTGTIDLARSAYRNVRLRARLLKPPALFPNMTARNLELRAILDGAFGTASFDYRLTADRFAFDDTGFEGARAAGKGRLSRAPITVPVAFSAARVTGVGDVAGGILRNLSLSGALKVTSAFVTGNDLKLGSDKLNGRIDLLLDLRTGRYEVNLNGGLRRYLIPGLGVVDVTSRLQAVPGPGGRGTRLVGTGTAQMVRLDNAFFASLAGGLPHIVTRLERGTDLVLHFTDLVLTAPDIRITGNGIRRRDGSFHFEGRGVQRTYGAFSIVLDGKIDHPTLDLHFDAPNATLGLGDVTAHLDPTAQGYDYTAKGQSRLGPFTSHGAILLPPGGQGRIAIAALDVSGAHASGALDIVTGGFAGALDVGGGGFAGVLRFRPQGGNQRIEGHLDFTRARLDAATLQRGKLDFTTVLDPAGATIDATATGIGLRQGPLTIGRFAAEANLRGGVGEVRASISGSRGRAFAIQTVTEVDADRYVVRAKGKVDQRDLTLLTPAVLTRAGTGWRLAATKLAFAGGEAEVDGRFGGGAVAFNARLARLPLSILDIGFPGLGLGGSSSGTLSYAATDGGAPTGRINLTVRGLSRSGLVLTSRPVDLGIAGVLDANTAAARAVVASGGRTIGRAQVRLSPLGGGGVAERLLNAPLFAQLRYSGPADTLWRLTGVELFDLSGPVAIAADATGRLADPRIQGVVDANGARLESGTTGTVITNLRAHGAFNGSRLVLTQFTGQAGKGSVSGSGAFDFAAANGFGIDLKLAADHAVLIDRDDIGATVTGPLRFVSTGSGGTISGDVAVNESRYQLGRATAATAVPRLNIKEINLPGGGEEDEIPAKPWTLAVHAKMKNRLMVTGLGLSSEWSADLNIGGAPDNPAITGRADLIRGDYEFAGREFELDRGIIRFAGEVPANPALDISANASETGLNATIHVTGNAQKPEISFTSVPALPEDELMSRLLFGTSITNLSAPEALQLAAAVAALQDGGTGINPINAFRRAVGLDRLRILPADPQTGQGTSVAAGKYITRRLFAEIITDGQGYSATQVEFQMTRWLSLLSSISTLGRQSANVRVSKDY
ncbi:translocation/assembly module TamB domain-containing protein [Hephaestia sp. GCM10023244]|uniref:translocation/assembly module TamB domain-containing protein n=1 Tax=unclassified Hephaestia TaxID=2631281 RepID=UPI0020770F7D|nr:translocation/assembly module TamB [Hephaestia sp. MAHUQ-44]MCM8729483.1 translocation/assembly module TamB [Hephaestia sp. MAHUQ-44]